jgi:hypothetical protein
MLLLLLLPSVQAAPVNCHNSDAVISTKVMQYMMIYYLVAILLHAARQTCNTHSCDNSIVSIFISGTPPPNAPLYRWICNEPYTCLCKSRHTTVDSITVVRNVSIYLDFSLTLWWQLWQLVVTEVLASLSVFRHITQNTRTCGSAVMSNSSDAKQMHTAGSVIYCVKHSYYVVSIKLRGAQCIQVLTAIDVSISACCLNGSSVHAV